MRASSVPISRVRVPENVVHGRFMRVHHGGNPKSCDRTVEAVSSGGRQKRGHRRAPQDGVELVVEADEVLVEVEEELMSTEDVQEEPQTKSEVAIARLPARGGGGEELRLRRDCEIMATP